MSEKEKNTETKETTKNKKGLKIALITLLIVVVIAGASVGGYFGYKYYSENKSTGTNERGILNNTHGAELIVASGNIDTKDIAIFNNASGSVKINNFICNLIILWCQIKHGYISLVLLCF